MNDTLRLLVTGPPASGKSMLSRFLAESLGLKYMSSGDYARSIAKPENVEALAVGDLSPDHLGICNWVARQMFENRRILIDGFPRSVEQFHAFDYDMVNLVIWVDASFSQCLSNSAMRGRKDDDVRTFHRRYMNYMKHTVPVIAMIYDTCGNFLHFANDSANDLGAPKVRLLKTVKSLLEGQHDGPTYSTN